MIVSRNSLDASRKRGGIDCGYSFDDAVAQVID